MRNDPNNKELELLEAQLRQLPQPPIPAGLEEKLLAAIPKRIDRSSRQRILWSSLAAALAAGLIFAFSLYLFHSQTQSTPQLAAIDIEQTITRAGFAAERLAAAQLLAQTPGGQEFARERLNYVIAQFPNTDAAKQANLELQSLSKRRIIQ
ncbi:MAG: hypothetical protein WC975_04005 [Phycisphaerae bacterium]